MHVCEPKAQVETGNSAGRNSKEFEMFKIGEKSIWENIYEEE